MPLLYAVIALILVGLIATVVNRRMNYPRNVTTIINIVLGLVVVGVGLWLINTYVPMAGSIKAILNIVVVLAVCVGILQAVGVWPEVRSMWSSFRHRSVTH